MHKKVSMAWAGQKIGVVGLGLAGTALARFFLQQGADLVVSDSSQEAITKAQAVLAPAPGQTTFIAGPLQAAHFFRCRHVFISPGVAPNQPVLQALRRRGIGVAGELVVLSQQAHPPIAAITGTNGKSTTTAWLGAMCRSVGLKAFVGGNLGPPVGQWLSESSPTDAVILEVSSYQIDGVPNADALGALSPFVPQVAAVLNVTPDHLERYRTFAAYVKSKARLACMVDEGGLAVLNFDDPTTRAMSSQCRGRVAFFSRRPSFGGQPLNGLALNEAQTHAVGHGTFAHLGTLALGHATLIGPHNQANAMAAWLMATTLAPHCDTAAWMVGYHSFRGLPHRFSLCGTHRGITFINDSKATNDDSAAVAVRAASAIGPLLVLVGGQDKKAGYEALAAALKHATLRHIVCYGDAQDSLALTLRAHNLAFVLAQDMVAAAKVAYAHARPGDVMLLSPACASFDAFANYQERGDTFVAWFNSLA